MRAYPVDWNGELQALAPFLKGRGGRVCISGRPMAAVNTFLKRVHDLLECHPETRCVVLDYEDAGTHDHSGILDLMEAKLEIAPEQPREAPQIKIIQNQKMKAGRDIHMGNLTINLPETSVQSFNLKSRLEKITSILNQGKDLRLVLLVQDCHKYSTTTIRWLWETLWHDHLHHLTNGCFLMLNFCMAEEHVCNHADCRALPDHSAWLPPIYQGDNLQETIADLKELFKTHVSDEDLAGFVLGILHALDFQPQALHSRLPIMLAASNK